MMKPEEAHKLQKLIKDWRGNRKDLAKCVAQRLYVENGEIKVFTPEPQTSGLVLKYKGKGEIKASCSKDALWDKNLPVGAPIFVFNKKVITNIKKKKK